MAPGVLLSALGCGWGWPTHNCVHSNYCPPLTSSPCLQHKSRRMRKHLDKQEAKRREAEESYSSLQSEVDVKTKKMSKLWNKLQATQQEIKAMHDEFVDARNGVQVRQARPGCTPFPFLLRDGSHVPS